MNRVSKITETPLKLWFLRKHLSYAVLKYLISLVNFFQIRFEFFKRFSESSWLYWYDFITSYSCAKTKFPVCMNNACIEVFFRILFKRRITVNTQQYYTIMLRRKSQQANRFVYETGIYIAPTIYSLHVT